MPNIGGSFSPCRAKMSHKKMKSTTLPQAQDVWSTSCSKEKSMSNRFLDLLARGAPIIADGGMGTMLMEVGLLFGDPPEQWNVLPDKQQHIRAVHRGYLEAGAQIILTNSFGGTP